VQVDPIKLTLKAPGTKRSKLEFYKLLSGFAFEFSLRCYSKAAEEGAGAGAVAAGAGAGAAAAAAAAAMSADLEVELIERVEFVALASAVVGTAGGKAATCGDLTRVAERPDSGFKAPQGVFLPFGAMVRPRIFKPVFKAPGFSA
jgi:hypothetical protein